MRTAIEMPAQYSDFLLKIAEKQPESKIVPIHFLEKVKTHLGCIQLLTPFLAPSEDGMEKRNLIVALLGDSITAGHFEVGTALPKDGSVKDYDDILRYFFIDIEAVYHEQLRKMLWNEYPLTPISFVNAGIAGDNIESMERRIYRDVVQLKPDLVILNGSMNFSIHHGDTRNYQQHFGQVVDILQNETDADLILVTPNMAVTLENDKLLSERVEVIRKTAAERNIPLADAYAVWEQFFERFPEVQIADLMANGSNHPTKAGHTVYALTIMSLLKNRREENNESKES